MVVCWRVVGSVESGCSLSNFKGGLAAGGFEMLDAGFLMALFVPLSTFDNVARFSISKSGTLDGLKFQKEKLLDSEANHITFWN